MRLTLVSRQHFKQKTRRVHYNIRYVFEMHLGYKVVLVRRVLAAMESQALAARSCVLVARERSEIWSHDYNGKTLSASLSPSLPALPERSW